ncbi:MAG: hypothetical protein ACRECV_21145 [Xanthobacteraceae bacterium]
MLRSTVSRIRFCICALGCAMLGASSFNWAQSVHAAGHRYAWVKIGASPAPPLETAEVWRVSARCVRPYFARALLRSEASLRAYYALAPEAVRARLHHPISLPTSAAPGRWYHLVNDAPNSRRRNSPDKEYVAELHVEYAEWYANVFKLEIEANQWRQRWTNVADQRLVLSESVRKNFRPVSGGDTRLTRTKGGFEDHVMTTLGLSGFPSDEEQALRSDCVKIDLVKKIMRSPSYVGQLWRWPVDQTAAFAFGLELVFIGIFLVPIALWVGTGDRQIAARRVRDAADRLAAKLRNFDRDKFISVTREQARSACVRTGAFLTSLGSVVNRRFRLLLTMAASPSFGMNTVRWGATEMSGTPSATSPPHPSPEYRQPW